MAGVSERHDDVELGRRRSDSEGEEAVPPPAAGPPAASGTVTASASGAADARPASLLQGLAAATDTLSSALPEDALSVSIQMLKTKQAELRNQKKRLAQDLRNAERRKKRLRQRARQLTDEDLVQVLMLRKHQRSDRSANDEASTTSAATSSSTSADGSGSASSSGARSSSDP